MPKRISEASALVVESTGESGDLLIQLISPGWGSSGYYSAEVLEKAAEDKVFPAGTQMFINHQTAEERNSRPEGDVMGLASVLREDAYWTGTALVAKAKPFKHWAPVLTDMKEAIGVSIRASAEVSEGVAEGRRGRIIDELVESQSVDYVTKAGRGGAILEVLESAAVAEATADDRRDQLMRALPARSYVRDYDPDQSVVYYSTYDPRTDKSVTLSQGFAVAEDDQSVTLTGTPSEVRVVTSYVPVSAASVGESKPTTDVPADSAGQTITPSPKEKKMPEIEEARLRQLEADAGRVTQAEARVTELQESASKTVATLRIATERVMDALAESGLPVKIQKRIVRESTTDLPLNDNGDLDEAAFDAKVKESREDFESLLPTGTGVVGFGTSSAVTESTTPTRTVNPWGRKIQEA